MPDLTSIVGFDETSPVNPLLGEVTEETSAAAQLAKEEQARKESEKAKNGSLLSRIDDGLSNLGKSGGAAKSNGGLSL